MRLATTPLTSCGAFDPGRHARADTFDEWRTLVSDSFVPLEVRSTRHLHAVFHAADAAVSRWIRTRRLEHCRPDLRDPILADRSA